MGSAWPVGELVASAEGGSWVNAKVTGSGNAGTGMESQCQAAVEGKGMCVAEEVAKVGDGGLDATWEGLQLEESQVDGPLQMPTEAELPTPPLELDDVLSTEFGGGFDLSQEMWQYA